MLSEPTVAVAGGERAPEPSAYVFDDEAHIGTLVCQVLGRCGFASQQFTSPAPFFVEIKKASPDLVVLDLALGQSDTVEVIRRLDVLNFKGKTLLISGRDEATLIEIAPIGERHGLAMLPPLSKPFRVSELKSRLDAPHSPSARATTDSRSERDTAAKKNVVHVCDAWT
jgi:DNA-binding response OmpR family regulator